VAIAMHDNANAVILKVVFMGFSCELNGSINRERTVNKPKPLHHSYGYALYCVELRSDEKTQSHCLG
ncbi:MAG: hypothetical protein KBG55_07840, partial [Polaromonas sp.]|nr:hypothetical protein [Polaromonas sp.]